MAVRDFTDKTKNRLLKNVTEVNKDAGTLKDTIDDVLLHIVHTVDILDLHQFIAGTKRYQKHMVDMNNMTKKEIEEIFANAHSIDASCGSDISQLVERNNYYIDKLKQLTAMINPNFDIMPAAQIKKQLADVNKKMKAIDGKIEEKIVSAAQSGLGDATLKNVKGFFGDAISAGVDLISAPARLIGGLFSGGPVGLVKESVFLVYDLYSDCATLSGHTLGLLSAGAAGIATLTGNSYYSNALLETAEDLGDADSLSDVLGATGDKDGQKFAKGVETVMDTASFVDDAIDIVKKPKKAFEGIGPGKFENLKAKDYYKKADKGLSASKAKKRQEEIKRYQKLYKIYGKEAQKAKTIKWVYEQAEKGTEAYESENRTGRMIGEEMEEMKFFGVVSDGKEVVESFEDMHELLTP